MSITRKEKKSRLNGRKEQISTFFDLEESLEERLLVLPLERLPSQCTPPITVAALVQGGDETSGFDFRNARKHQSVTLPR